MATNRASAVLAVKPRWLLHRRMGSAASPIDGNENKGLADMVVAIAERRDGQAFDALFKHYGPRLKAYFRRLGADSASAEDLMSGPGCSRLPATAGLMACGANGAQSSIPTIRPWCRSRHR
jgi:hypothetical protein